MSQRPAVVVVVVGTGTEVGKTWVAERLLRAWRAAGLAVAARKPAQSFASGDATTDADRLGAASGEGGETVCPPHRWYPVPMAPPMAAEALGRVPPTLVDLVGEVIWPPQQADVGLVETAGGVRSPQAVDGDAVDLVAALRPEHVVLVADAGLGTINGVLLSVAALAPVVGPRAPTAPAVVLDRFDPGDELHRRNRDWLTEQCGLDVTVVVPGALETLAGRLARRPATRPGADRDGPAA